MVPNPTPFPLSSVWVLMRERMLSLSAVNILCFLFESKHMIEETSPMRQSDDCFYGSIACNNMNFNPCSKDQQRGEGREGKGRKGCKSLAMLMIVWNQKCLFLFSFQISYYEFRHIVVQSLFQSLRISE